MPHLCIARRKTKQIKRKTLMNYPSKKYASQRVAEAQIGSRAKRKIDLASLASKIRGLMAGTFLFTWLYLSQLSDGLFMKEACLSGIIVCFVMMFKAAK